LQDLLGVGDGTPFEVGAADRGDGVADFLLALFTGGGDDHAGQRHAALDEGDINGDGGASGERDGPRLLLIADATHGNGERARRDVGEGETTVVSGGTSELGAGHGDLCGGYRLAIVGVDDAADDGTGGLGCERSGSGDRQREPEQGCDATPSRQRSAPKDGKQHGILTRWKAARTRVEGSA
jgi:hypothetical protein